VGAASGPRSWYDAAAGPEPEPEDPVSTAQVSLATPNAVPRELQQMWLSLVRSAWSSMAVVPLDARTSAQRVARAVVDMASFYDLGAFRLLDAQGASLTEGTRMARELASARSGHERLVVPVDSPLESAGANALLLAADAVLLVVRLGSTPVQSARTVIEVTGRERVVGCVAVSERATG
jgi:hypothetical protein